MAFSNRRVRPRRGAPVAPKRRSSIKQTSTGPEAGLGFESLVHAGHSGHSGVADESLFESWELGATDGKVALSVLDAGRERRNSREHLRGNPRDAVGTSVFLHIAVVALMLFSSDFSPFSEPPLSEQQPIDKTERLVMFVEPEELLPAVPVQPVPQTVPAAEPPPPAPQVADNGILIPKASKAPPPDETTDFMNDLPFSQGNTDEFYTDKEVNEPGESGTEDANDASKNDDGAEEREAEDEDVSERAAELADGRLAEERLRRRLRDFALADPLDARRAAGAGAIASRPSRDGRLGSGGEGGTFEDIRRFLADKRFSNPDGGLVTGGPTLYYNDKGANLVPWLSRMINEVKRNWLVPYSASFRAGHVAVGLVVNRNGSVVELKTIVPSGTAGFDNAAVGAIRAADLLPLPSDYPDDRFEIILVFWYNERPYDIFG